MAQAWSSFLDELKRSRGAIGVQTGRQDQALLNPQGLSAALSTRYESESRERQQTEASARAERSLSMQEDAQNAQKNLAPYQTAISGIGSLGTAALGYKALGGKFNFGGGETLADTTVGIAHPAETALATEGIGSGLADTTVGIAPPAESSAIGGGAGYAGLWYAAANIGKQSAGKQGYDESNPLQQTLKTPALSGITGAEIWKSAAYKKVFGEDNIMSRITDNMQKLELSEPIQTIFNPLGGMFGGLF
jgi:hypothetical protein